MLRRPVRLGAGPPFVHSFRPAQNEGDGAPSRRPHAWRGVGTRTLARCGVARSNWETCRASLAGDARAPWRGALRPRALRSGVFWPGPRFLERSSKVALNHGPHFLYSGAPRGPVVVPDGWCPWASRGVDSESTRGRRRPGSASGSPLENAPHRTGMTPSYMLLITRQ